VNNALGEPQVIVLLGGTSEIGQAIVRRLVSPATTTVVLACRAPDQATAFAEELRGRGVATVDVVPLDALDPASHPRLIMDLAERHGDLDVVVLAVGVLGRQSTYDADPAAAAESVAVNFGSVVSLGLSTAARFREQAHGQLVVLSSVAGERVRRANFVYGSTKAGVDGFAQGLGDSLAGTGAGVLIVRPGFVKGRMTAGLRPSPLSSTPDQVAAATVAGLAKGRRIVWVPPPLRLVFAVLRHLPYAVWRRLPLDR
jgi:decaprenylphospho-beta-D-erythro-pentofuranosid-2-ulose 2-reductase